MQLTDKQLEANRANSLKSTGPRTEVGKRNSSRNRATHGILANTILIEGESARGFAALLNSLCAEHRPEGPTERILVERMAVAQWRLRRIWNLESVGISREIRNVNAAADPTQPLDPAVSAMQAYSTLAADGRNLELLSRYEHRFDRQYYRALEALHRHQERRRERQNKGAAAPESQEKSSLPFEATQLSENKQPD